MRPMSDDALLGAAEEEKSVKICPIMWGFVVGWHRVTKNVNAHATTEKYLVARKKQWIADSARSNYLERKGIGVDGRGP